MKFEPRFYDLLFTTNVWSVFFYGHYSAQLLHDHLRCCTTPGIAAASAQIPSGCFLSSAQANGSTELAEVLAMAAAVSTAGAQIKVQTQTKAPVSRREGYCT